MRLSLAPSHAMCAPCNQPEGALGHRWRGVLLYTSYFILPSPLRPRSQVAWLLRLVLGGRGWRGGMLPTGHYLRKHSRVSKVSKTLTTR